MVKNLDLLHFEVINRKSEPSEKVGLATMVTSHILLLTLLAIFASEPVSGGCAVTSPTTLTCRDLADTDLPLKGNFTGDFARLRIYRSVQLTTVPANAFGSVGQSLQSVLIKSNPNLNLIQSNFLGEKPIVQRLQIINAPKLRQVVN